MLRRDCITTNIGITTQALDVFHHKTPLATGMNGAATVAGKNFTLTGAGVAAAGQTAAAGATAFGGMTRAMVEEDAKWYKNLGEHKAMSPFLAGSCAGKTLQSLKWEEFCTVEDGWSHIEKRCMKK